MRYQEIILSTFLLLFFITPSSGQKSPIKWGKIPKEDLSMTSYDRDPEAEAVVLCDYGKLTFEFAPGVGLIYRFSRHKRIKILKSSAAEWGNISIDYYSHNNAEKILNLKAQVFSPDGEKQKISKSDIFKEKVTDYWDRKKLAIPNIQEGSVIEYKYDLLSDRIVALQDWYFQDEIPTRLSELVVSIPDFLTYVYLFQSKENIVSSNIESGGAADPDFKNAQIRTSTYIMKDMPALKEETYVTTMEDYLARIKFQLREYQSNNGLINKYLTTWDDVAKRLEEDKNFGHQYSKKREYKKLLEAAEPILEKAKTPKDKIKAAQNFIVSNVAWNGRYRMYPDGKNNINQLFAKKEAASGGLNLMLLALLRSQDLNAWPLLCSTRRNGKMFPLYPIVDQFGHTMVYVELEGESIILDAHDAFHPIGYPTVNSLNKMGWVVDQKNPRWVDIVAPNSVERYLATFTVDEKGTLNGNINASIEGYKGIQERKKLNTAKDGKWQETMMKKYPESTIDSIVVENKNDLDLPLKINMNCTIPEAAQVNGDFIYLSPIVVGSYDENIFKLEKRDYPVDMPYPFKEMYVLNLQIPDGYAIDELPEEANMSLPNNGGKFKFLVNAVTEDRVQIISSIDIKQLYYTPEEYLAIKYFFDLIVEKQGEQIVLKKKI